MIGTRRIYVDVTVRHPLAPSSLSSSAEQRHWILHRAEVAKHSKYDELAKQNHASFVPFVVDTFGNISDKSLQLLRDIIESSHNFVQYHIGRRLYFTSPSSTSLSSHRPQPSLEPPPPTPLIAPACA
jgi:hypothetical protein